MGKMAQIKAGSHTIKDDKRWLVVAPQTHDASRYFGGGTSWCISTSNDRYWKDYYYAQTIVMIKDRTKKPDNDLFKVAIVGNAYEQLWDTNQDDKLNKIRELVKHVDLYNVNDNKLSGDQKINYLGQLPEDLIEDLMNYFNDDEIYERQNDHYYELARERYDNGGKEELLKSLFNTTVAYFDADTDLDEDAFGDLMSRQFADEIQDGNWDEFLSELWGACMTYQGVEDDSFYAEVNTRNFKNLISDTSYDLQTYLDLAKEILKNEDIANMDNIIKDALIKTSDNGDPYTVIKRQANQLKDTNYNDIILSSLNAYNVKNNPTFLQGQRSLSPDFMGIVNKFKPKNIEDVIKVLSINPRAKDMIDQIQRYRRDLYESKKKRSIKYRDFYKFKG
jgi:hypothetical protein